MKSILEAMVIPLTFLLVMGSSREKQFLKLDFEL